MTARVVHSSTLRPPEGRRRKSSGLLGQSSGERSVDESHSSYRRRRSNRRGRSQSAPRTRREASQERSVGHSDRRQSNPSMDLLAVQRDHHARLKSISSRRHSRSHSGAHSVCSLPGPRAPGATHSVCSRANPPPPPPRKTKSSVVPPPPPVVIMKSVREDDGTESTSPSTDPGSELPRRTNSYQPESYASNSSQVRNSNANRGRSASASCRASTSVVASGRSSSVGRRRAASRGRVRSRSVGRSRGQAVKKEELLTPDGSVRDGHGDKKGRFSRPSRMEGTGRSLSRSRGLASGSVRGGEASLLDESARSARSARSVRSDRSHARSESRSRRYRQTYGDLEHEPIMPQRSFDQMDESAAGSRRSKSTSRSMSRSRRMREGARHSPSPEFGSRGSRRSPPRRSRSHSRSRFQDRRDRSPEPSQDCQEYQEYKAHRQDHERPRGPQEDSPFDQDDDNLPPDNGPGKEINLVIDSQGRGRFHIAARSPTNAPLNGNTANTPDLHCSEDNHSDKRQQYLTFDIQLDEPSRRYLIHASMGRLDIIRAIHPGMNILRTLSYWNNLQKKRYGTNGGADAAGEGGRLGIVSRNRTNVVLMTLVGEYAHRAWERDPAFQRELERFVEDALQFHACLNGGEGESATLTSGADGAPEAGVGGGGLPIERRVSTNGETDPRDASSERSKKGGGGRAKLLGKVFLAKGAFSN